MSDTVSEPPELPQNMPSAPVEHGLKWPKVIGILNIVFGVLGIGGGILSVFLPAISGAMMKFALSLEPETVDDAFWENFDAVEAKWAWVTNIYGGVFTLAHILLLIGGIACVRFKRKCSPLFWQYSVLTFLCIGFYTWMMLATPMLKEQTEASYIEGMDGATIEAQIILAKVFGLAASVSALVLPAFLIIWFLRQKIKTDLQMYFS